MPPSTQYGNTTSTALNPSNFASSGPNEPVFHTTHFAQSGHKDQPSLKLLDPNAPGLRTANESFQQALDEMELSPKATFNPHSFSRALNPSNIAPELQGKATKVNSTDIGPTRKQQFLSIQDLQEPSRPVAPNAHDPSRTGQPDPNILFYTQPSPSSYDRQPANSSRRPSYASQFTSSSMGSSRRRESEDGSYMSSSPAGDDKLSSNVTSRANSAATISTTTSNRARINPISFPQPVSIFVSAICNFETNTFLGRSIRH